MAIKTATDATFEAEVLHNDRPVVVDFWAAWCGPCKLVAPEMEKLAAKYEGSIDIVKVDVDANPGLSRAFNIMSIPTIAFFAPGKQPMGVVGFRPAEQLETQFQLASYPKIEAAASTTDGADAAAAPGDSTPGAASETPSTPEAAATSGRTSDAA
jgi:thioredoxin 1